MLCSNIYLDGYPEVLVSLIPPHTEILCRPMGMKSSCAVIQVEGKLPTKVRLACKEGMKRNESKRLHPVPNQWI